MISNRSLTVTTFQNELRNPLKNILGMVEYLNKSHLTTEQREYVDYIFSSAKSLLSLADYLSSESSNVYGCCFENISPYTKTRISPHDVRTENQPKAKTLIPIK